MHTIIGARWCRLLGVAAATAVLAGAASSAASAQATVAAKLPAAKRFSMAGYVIDAKYTRGRNTGNTFEQTYKAKTVQGVPIKGPDVGAKFPPVAYVAMAIGNHQVYIAWIDAKSGALVDVFVMNLATHKVYDYAPDGLHPESTGTIVVKKAGHKVP